MVEILDLQEDFFPLWTALAFSIVGVVSVIFGISILVYLVAKEKKSFSSSFCNSALWSAFTAVIGSTGLFLFIFFSSFFFEIEDTMAAIDEQYSDFNVVFYKEGNQVEDIAEALESEREFSTIEASITLEDGTEHENAYMVFERSKRDNISHTFSLAERENKNDSTIIHSKSQLVEISTGENLQELTERGAAPAFGFDEKRNLVEYGGDTGNSVPGIYSGSSDDTDSSWTGALATVLKWTGAIGGALAVSTFFVNFGMKISKDRANKVRTKMREKA